MSLPHIEATGLGKTYASASGLLGRNRPLHAVVSVNFAIPAGTTFGLVGESGSGKSTIARMLLGVEAPSTGSIAVAGRQVPLLEQSALSFRRTLQAVLQDSNAALNPRMRVGEIIAEPLRIHRLVPDRAARRARVDELLLQVGLDPAMAARFPVHLSGGQRQRVAIARALVLAPQALVLDEPVSALDVSVQAQILNLLRDLQDRLGLTYLLISHNMGVVAFMSDTIGVLYLGHLVEAGPKAAVLGSPRHPYTRSLLAAADPSISLETAAGVEGEIPSPLDLPSGCPFSPRCPLVTDRCRSERPVTRDIGPGHAVACHLA